MASADGNRKRSEATDDIPVPCKRNSRQLSGKLRNQEVDFIINLVANNSANAKNDGI